MPVEPITTYTLAPEPPLTEPDPDDEITQTHGWWHRPLGTNQGVWRLATILGIPSEESWTQYHSTFHRLPPKMGILVHPGDYLVRGHFRVRERPTYSVGVVRDDGVLWLECGARNVQSGLRKHRIYAPYGTWHALRGAMLLSAVAL